MAEESVDPIVDEKNIPTDGKLTPAAAEDEEEEEEEDAEEEEGALTASASSASSAMSSPPLSPIRWPPTILSFKFDRKSAKSDEIVEKRPPMDQAEAEVGGGVGEVGVGGGGEAAARGDGVGTGIGEGGGVTGASELGGGIRV
jgi:hypothetical protein